MHKLKISFSFPALYENILDENVQKYVHFCTANVNEWVLNGVQGPGTVESSPYSLLHWKPRQDPVSTLLKLYFIDLKSAEWIHLFRFHIINKKQSGNRTIAFYMTDFSHIVVWDYRSVISPFFLLFYSHFLLLLYLSFSLFVWLYFSPYLSIASLL